MEGTNLALILKLGQDNNLSELNNVLTTADHNSVIEFVKGSCRTGDGPALFRYVLAGLGWGEVTEAVEKIRIKVVLEVVDEVMRNPGVPNKNALKFLDSLFGELEQFSDKSISRLFDKCMSEFEGQEHDETGLRWLPLLGRLLTVVERRGKFEDDAGAGDSDHSGKVFKDNIIQDVCHASWVKDKITSICMMFKEVKLSSEQQMEVFDKVCNAITTLSAQALPPLVFQLLHLSKDSSALSLKLVTTVNEFFSTKLSLEDRKDKTNMDIESLDMISEDHTTDELQQAEGTVIYHLTQAAKMGHPVAKEIIKTVKAANHAPEMVLSPFSLFLALALSSVKQWHDQLIESLRQAISRAIMLEEKRLGSAWLRSNLMRLPDAGEMLSQLISQSRKAGGWDLIGQGLVDLGLALLDQSSINKVDKRLKLVHNLGARLLLKVVKKQSESVSSVLDPLTNRILVCRQAPQYTEALRIIVKDSAAILMEKPNIVSELIENLQRLSFPAGRRTLTSLLPLARLSRPVRDSIILVLRKALFSKVVQTRQMATTGVMLLLKTFRISTNRAMSQLSQSSGSLSQLAVDVHRGASTSNEALCTELLGVLKRCFSQPGEVRLTLYQGIMDVVTKNPELCEDVLEIFYGHVLQLWGEEGTRHRWQLDLRKLGRDTEDGWTLNEPIGWFLHCLQMLVGKGQQVVSEDCDVLDKLVKLLDEMAEQYSECELGDLGFEDSDNFDRKTTDGEKRCIQLEQLQGVLEALMEYVITHGGDRDESKSKLLLNLQKKHSVIENLLNTSASKKKGKKGEKKGKTGEKKDTEDEGKNDETDGHVVKRVGFSPPSNCFSLKALSLILYSVLLDRDPLHQDALSLLRNDDEFCSFFVTMMDAKITQMANALVYLGDEGPHSDNMFRYLSNIGQTLFQHSIICQEQIQSVVLKSTNCLLQLLKLLLSHFPRRKLQSISSLTDSNPGSATDVNLNPVLVPVMKKVMRKLAHYIDNLDSESEDDVANKLSTSVTIFSLLFSELDQHDDGIDTVKEWIKKFMDKIEIEDPIVLKPIVMLLLQSVVKVKSSPSLGLEIAKGLHSLTGDLDTSVQVEAADKHAWLSNNSKEFVHPLLLDHLEGLLETCEVAINWLKALSSVLSKNSNMANAESSLCLLLARQVNAASELVKTAFPLGQPMDGVLKLLIRLYTCIGSLTKHFNLRIRQGKNVVAQAKFDKLVLMINSQLTKHVYNLITWLENKQKERDQQAAAVRAAKHKTVDPSVARAKVLRESRYIPNLILKIETLEKDLIKLGKRIGQNLCEGNKVSVSRDFRIKFSEDMMQKLMDEEEDESGEESDDSADDSRVHTIPPTGNSTVMSDVTNAEVSQNDQSQEPPSKKLKSSKLGTRKENVRT